MTLTAAAAGARRPDALPDREQRRNGRRAWPARPTPPRPATVASGARWPGTGRRSARPAGAGRQGGAADADDLVEAAALMAAAVQPGEQAGCG